MNKKEVKIIVVALSTPILIGIYENDVLIDEIVSQERSSEILPSLFSELLEKYQINTIVYANGPGSFMSIKVSYIFLKSLCMINNFTFLSTDAFYFNENSPIKAVGKLYFVKTLTSIETVRYDEPQSHPFKLPQKFLLQDFNTDTLPFYGIDAVS